MHIAWFSFDARVETDLVWNRLHLREAWPHAVRVLFFPLCLGLSDLALRYGCRSMAEIGTFRAMQAFSEISNAMESPAITEEAKSKEALDLPWNVVVHNDPVNLMSYVTMVFQKVFGYPKEKAEMHMLEVHRMGRSILWSGMRERAELFVQQLHGYLLLATIERTN
jgi:ATP-dependent Clp protease adaptor protein ClpS